MRGCSSACLYSHQLGASLQGSLKGPLKGSPEGALKVTSIKTAVNGTIAPWTLYALTTNVLMVKIL